MERWEEGPQIVVRKAIGTKTMGNSHPTPGEEGEANTVIVLDGL